jgi:hypothetical protein
METIHHLDPPLKSFIRLHRFSPYFEESERWGLEPKSPAEIYRHLYPFPEESLARIAYRFDTAFSQERANSAENAALGKAIRDWQTQHGRSHLVMFPGQRELIVIDTRRCAKRRRHRLSGLERRVFEYCDSAHSRRNIVKAFEVEASEGEVDCVLESLTAARLMLCEAGRYLSLATRYRTTYKRRVPFVVGYPKRVRVRQLLELRRRLKASPVRIATHMVRGTPAGARTLGLALLSGLSSITLRGQAWVSGREGRSPGPRE